MDTSSILPNRLIAPLKWQTSGSILAADLALKHGFAINLGVDFAMRLPDWERDFAILLI